MSKKILIGVALLLATTLNAHAYSSLPEDKQTECDKQIVFFTDPKSIVTPECVLHYRKSRSFIPSAGGYIYRVSKTTLWSPEYQSLDEDDLPIHPSLKPRNPMMQTRD